MAKICLLSFDDGTIYDRQLVKLLNQYGIPGTFNLNSGLEDFVWRYDGRFPIRRLRLWEISDLYRGHEVASHTLRHPRLDSLTPPQLRQEVTMDQTALRTAFGLNEVGFAVPFTACGEREIRILRRHVPYIRLSECSGDFSLPPDPWHIPIHGLYNDPDIRERLAAFAACPLDPALFVLAGHSYEMEVLNQWEEMESLLQYLRALDFQFMTTMDFVRTFYQNG